LISWIRHSHTLVFQAKVRIDGFTQRLTF